MITITINSGEQLDQTEFESIADLQDHLASHNDFSDYYKAKISERSLHMKKGIVKPIPLADIEKGMDDLLH